MSDEIYHPPHYTRGKIEVWDFIADQGLDFFAGNVVKYLCRAGHKGDKLTDLKKALAYMARMVNRADEEANLPTLLDCCGILKSPDPQEASRT